MTHVRLHQVSGREGRAERQFARQDAGGDDARELARVVARLAGVGAAHAEQVEHGGLGLEDGAAAYGADFDARHRDGDVQGAVEAAGNG